MKKIKYFIISAMMLFLTACDDLLDPEVVVGTTTEQIIRSYNNTRSTATAIYSFLPDGFSYIDGTLLAGASDEAEHTLETNLVQKFNAGSWNAVDNPDNAWSTNFKGIYNANLTLSNIDSVRMEYLRLDPSFTSQELYKINMENMGRWKYEIRFLRAFFYFELVKRYGGVPIITEPLGLNDDFTLFPRRSLSDCIQFIVEECDSTAKALPLISTDEDLGRATKGAALALKSRVLLYAASDLYNDPSWAGGYEHPELISMTDEKTREERWIEAALAAKDVIDLASYSMSGGYENLFRSYNNQELILTRRYGESGSFERANYPIGYDGGNSGITPLGNLVDAYEVLKRGVAMPFDWNNEEHSANPYIDRDPRLAATVLTNNTMFKGGAADPRPVEIWAGGRDGKGAPRATKTGYYMNKWIDPNLDLVRGQSSVHSWVLIRYAEILLNYAEAVTFGYGYNGRVPGSSITTPAFALTTIRRRVGMPLVFAQSKEQIIEAIKHERRIELAFEDHRLWDLRRWMDAPEALSAPARGVEITKVDDDTFSYKNIELEKRVWDNKMYFYPIPQKEVEIAKWPQNPLW